MPPLTGLEICWWLAFLQRCHAYGAANLRQSQLAEFLGAVFRKETQLWKCRVIW